MPVEYVGDNNVDGTCVGRAAASKIGFYGHAPAVQPATIADATDAATAITKVNLVIAALVAVGLIAAS